MVRAFASFASSNMSGALQRIHGQAVDMGGFDVIRTMDEGDLAPGFRKEFADRLTIGSRGFGYWAWKPQVVSQVMGELAQGDTLLYADAGCHLNPRGRARLDAYFSLLSEETPIVVFQQDPHDTTFGLNNPNIGDWPNRNWTKGDLVDYLGMRERAEVLDAQTYYATTFLMMKCPRTLGLLDDWLNVIRHDWRLVDDSPSRAPNLPGFVEHRHDQAIFSLLCHDAPRRVISSSEIVYPKIRGRGGDWKRLAEFPIHARRDRTNARDGTLIGRLGKLLRR